MYDAIPPVPGVRRVFTIQFVQLLSIPITVDSDINNMDMYTLQCDDDYRQDYNYIIPPGSYHSMILRCQGLQTLEMDVESSISYGPNQEELMPMEVSTVLCSERVNFGFTWEIDCEICVAEDKWVYIPKLII